MPRSPKDKSESLREACIREAFAIIETSGLENLSLREVARRLGVSHQAPYKHFPSRDHILAEVIRRSYEGFAQYLESRPRAGKPDADLHTMGQAYLLFALAHPLQYRLMFSTPLPDLEQHPEMMQSARRAFDLLHQAIEQHLSGQKGSDAHLAEKDALFVWSSLHGLASILQSDALKTLTFAPEVLQNMVQHTFERIGFALGIKPDGNLT